MGDEKDKSEMDATEEVETTENKSTGKTVEELQAELANAQKLIKDLNRENAGRRKKLEEYEEAERLKAEADKTDLQKAQDRAAALEKQIADLTVQGKKDKIRHAVEITAAKLSFTDPEDAYTLADLSAVEIGEDGKVKGVEQALKALLEKKPYLKGAERQKSPDLEADKRNNAGASTPRDEIVARKRAEYPGI